MKHTVLKPFIDKESGVLVTLVSAFECTNYERVNKLHAAGFIQKNNESEKLNKKPSTTKKVNKDAAKN